MCKSRFIRMGQALLVAVFFLTSICTVNAQAVKTIVAGISGVVLDTKGAPIIDASVYLDGPRKVRTTTDATGHFVFATVEPGTYTVRVEARDFESVAQSNVAIQNEDVSLTVQLSSSTGLKTIGRVSTTAAGSSINVTAAPSYGSSPGDMAAQGQTQWGKMLQELPGVSVAGRSGSLAGGVPGEPNAEQVVSIRGSLPYENALLIDNMPMYGISTGTLSGGPGTGTDLSAYSAQTFRSFDVIEGPGAQSPSIVNSIGGSLNLHPAGQVDRSHIDASLQNDPFGGYIGNFTGAGRWGKLSATLTYGFNDSPGPLGTSSTQYLTAFDASSIATVNGQPFTCGASCASSFLYSPGYTGNVAGAKSGLVICCTTLDTGWTQHSVSGSLNYQLSPNVTAQVFYAGQNQFVPVNNVYYPVTFAPPAGYTGAFPVGTSLQFFQDSDNLATGQISNVYEGKLLFNIGNGQLQLAALTNQSRLLYGESAPFLQSSSPHQVQLFGGGTVAGVPTTFNGETSTVTFQPYLYYYTDTANNRDLSASYVTSIGETGRATVSYVHSYYDNPLALFSQYNGVISTTPPYSNSEVTDEFRFGYGVNPTPRTSLDFSEYFVSARYHVYSPADSTKSTYIDESFHTAAPRLSFVWHPTHDVAFRASAGGGLALAPLSYLVGTNGSPVLSNGVYTQTLPNLGLQPEHSASVDFGFDKRLAPTTVLSVDAYHTNLFGQLYRDQSFAGQFNGLPLYTTEYRNLGVSRYDGVDLQVRDDKQRGYIWGLSFSLTRAYVVSVPSGFYNTLTCSNCTNLTVVPGPNFNGTYGAVSVPYSQGFGSLGYRWSRDTFVSADASYFGNNNEYFRPAFVAFDANASLALSKNLSLQATFRNISNMYSATVANFGQGIGSPTVAGQPYYLPSASYEARAFIVSMRLHL